MAAKAEREQRQREEAEEEYDVGNMTGGRAQQRAPTGVPNSGDRVGRVGPETGKEIHPALREYNTVVHADDTEGSLADAIADDPVYDAFGEQGDPTDFEVLEARVASDAEGDG